ncbi:MAG TPA: chorismate synthase, partial [Flavobacterium sp.]|nr:chorismate synthase [Flavobacterium sp.]
MAGNSFGTLFRLTTFGESHGPAIGGVVDGCPPGVLLDIEAIRVEMDRRRPGQSAIVTQRKEADEVEFLSGLFDGRTTGAPIGFIIRNEDAKSADYDHLAEVYRPSHADYVYDQKYGLRDHRGGGRSSARETACRVVAGAIAKQVIGSMSIAAYVSSVGDIFLEKPYQDLDLTTVEQNPVRCPDPETAER